MALSPSALFKFLVSPRLPVPTNDGPEAEGFARGTKYRELFVQNLINKAHPLADEGSYLVCNNAQTGIIEGTSTAYSATAATLIIDNNEDPNGGKSFYLDYVDLIVSAAGVTASAVTAKWLALVLDKGPRYSSGGTEITSKLVNPNMLMTAVPKFNIFFGALTATAASKQARTICGQRIYRLPVTATTVPDALGDRMRLEFGSMEPETTVALGTTGALMANVFQSVVKAPPIVIPPGYSMVLSTWDQATTYSTGVTWLPEIAGWAR